MDKGKIEKKIDLLCIYIYLSSLHLNDVYFDKIQNNDTWSKMYWINWQFINFILKNTHVLINFNSNGPRSKLKRKKRFILSIYFFSSISFLLYPFRSFFTLFLHLLHFVFFSFFSSSPYFFIFFASVSFFFFPYVSPFFIFSGLHLLHDHSTIVAVSL